MRLQGLAMRRHVQRYIDAGDVEIRSIEGPQHIAAAAALVQEASPGWGMNFRQILGEASWLVRGWTPLRGIDDIKIVGALEALAPAALAREAPATGGSEAWPGFSIVWRAFSVMLGNVDRVWRLYCRNQRRRALAAAFAPFRNETRNWW